MTIFRTYILLSSIILTIGCAGVAPGEEPLDPGGVTPPEDGFKGDDPSPPISDPNCPDTAPTVAPMADGLGPAARITTMRVPKSMAQAGEFGCDLVVGNHGGQGLTALTRAIGVDVNALVTPDASGNIESIILGHLSGWPVGQRGNATTNLDLRMYMGIQTDRGFSVDETSFDDAGNARVTFPATVGCNELETEPRSMEFAVPVETASVPLSLEAAQVRGAVSVDQTGFSITDGLIVGYVPVDAIVSIIADVQAACESPNAPMACSTAGALLQGDPNEVTRTLVLPFLYGLDAKLSADGQTVESCQGDDCNAMSVCIAFEAESVAVVR